MSLADVFEAAGLPRPVAEYQFAPPRKWRFDWAWPAWMVALEIDGGLFVQGRHSRGRGREADMAKINEALCLGWKVLAVSPDMVNDGRVIDWLERLLREEESDGDATTV